MKIALLVIALIASCAFVAGSDVKILTPENFDDVVGKDVGVFVEFFAPWCGHCKSLAPEYELAATAFKNLGSSAIIASVDADAHRDLGGRFEVKGFPTLKWFPAGSLTPEAYSGARTAQGIVEFVNSKVGTSAKIAAPKSNVVDLDPSNFDSVVMNANADVLVEFYAPWCGHCKNLAPVYEKVANAMAGEENVVVAKVDADKHRDLGERYGVTGFPTLKFFPKNNKAGEDYNGGRDESAFIEFFNTNSGTERMVGGGFKPTAGRIDELDTLVKEFYSAPLSERDSFTAKFEQAVASSTDADAKEYSKFYTIALKNILAGKNDYAGKELARLEKMSKSTSLNAKTTANLAKRINIMRVFVEAASQETDAKEL